MRDVVRKMQSMGKRGDVSFTLVVLVALACALAALGVMVQAVLEEQQKAEQFDALLSELEFQQAYALAAVQSMGRAVSAEAGEAEDGKLEERLREHASLREQRRAVAGTQGAYAALQREESVRFVATEKGAVLEVSGIVIEAREGQSSIKRTLDVRVEIRRDGSAELASVVR